MNTNAELSDRAMFLAVHSDFPLTVSGPIIGDVATVPRQPLEPRQFLRDFLSPNRNHVQIMVIGESGSGKSHFIKWMELNIPDSDNRHVIAIPRAGVSLRGIIEAILALLPEHDAQPYRHELDRTGREYVTSEDLRYALILSLAAVVRGSRAEEGEEQDLEGALLATLPNLLADPYIYQVFWANQPLLEHIVNHVLRPSPTYGNEFEPNRAFAIDDLPLTMSDSARMSDPAQLVVAQLITDNAAQQLAVKILNRNLDAAIARVVGLSAERLIQLIQEVRRHLARENKELVLLFEDLALSQGLSGALFDALLDEGRPDKADGLCRLRWAAAVTTGYYTANVPATVKTRILQVIHTDLATSGDDAPARDDAVISFAARYLNAARLDDSALREWASALDSDAETPPNACLPCSFRSQCHAAFGQEEDRGLYPFNRNALLNFLRQSDPAFEHRFNPRFLIQNILATTMDSFAPDIVDGIFPTDAFQRRMGGHNIPPAISQELASISPDQASQQIGILSFWADGLRGLGRLVDAPASLYEAFGVSKPDIPIEDAVDPVPKDEPSDDSQSRPSVYIDAIRGWGNGATMGDNLLNRIRPVLFEAIVSHIDWDNEGILRTYWAGSGLPFRNDSISFMHQGVQVRPRPVMIRVPMTDDPSDLLEAAVALEALEQYREYGSWTIPGGSRSLRTLATALDRWSQEIVSQIRTLSDPAPSVDVVSAGVELLAVGAALAGRPARANATLSDVLNALFEEWPHEAGQSTEWQSLYKRLEQRRAKVREIVLSWTTGSKGGGVSPFIRPTLVIDTLRRVRRDWQLAVALPEREMIRDYTELARLHRDVVQDLPTAARREWLAKTEWLTHWRANVDKDTTRRMLVDGARTLVELAVSKSIPHQTASRTAFRDAIEALDKVQLDEAVRKAQVLAEESQPTQRLPDIGQNFGTNAMAAALNFLHTSDRFLTELELGLAQLEKERSAGDLAVRDHQAAIEQALASLLGTLEELLDSGETTEEGPRAP